MTRKPWNDEAERADAFDLSDAEFLHKYPERTADALRGARRRHGGWWEKHNGYGPDRQSANQQQVIRREPRIPAPPVYLRAAVFDIETTSFNTAGYEGMLVCCSVLPLDSDEITTVSVSLDDLDDRRVLVETLELLNQYDILIGHNIQAFDNGWLWSRCMFYGLPSPRSWWIFDTYQASRTLAIKSGSKKMTALCDYFQIDYIKTAVQKTTWNNIRSRFPDEFQKAHDNIVYHCEEDVKSNRLLFYELYPYTLEIGTMQAKITKWRNAPKRTPQ